MDIQPFPCRVCINLILIPKITSENSPYVKLSTQGPSELEILCRIQCVRSLSNIAAMGAI